MRRPDEMPSRRRPSTIHTGLFLGLFLSTLLWSSAEAQNRIQVGYAEAAPGARGVPLIVTATNDVPIHGYSLAFTYPSPELRLSSISLLGTNIALMEPDFVAPTINNALGFGTLGVIFSFEEPITLSELPPTPIDAAARIIARMKFDVITANSGGVFPIRLRDGIGTPASHNRFTSAGVTVEPELVDGSFVVRGGNTLSISKHLALAGATPNLPVFVYASHPQPLDGFQCGFHFETNALILNDITFSGTDLIRILTSERIESFNFDIDPNFTPELTRATAAVLFDSSPPFDGQTLPPAAADSPQSIVRLNFNVLGAADDEKQYQDLSVQDVGVPGAIDNRFFIDAASFDPQLVSGKIYFSTGGATGRLLDAETRLPVPNAQVLSDPDDINARTNASGVFTFAGNDLPAGEYTLKFSLDGYYSLRSAPIVVNGSGSIEPVGDFLIYPIPESPPQPFVRGFVNRDRRLDVSDGITLLNALFLGAGNVPCQQAADVNDDNKMDISDGVFLLNYLFVGGARPREPFSLDKTGCALDPTPTTNLTCEEFVCED